MPGTHLLAIFLSTGYGPCPGPIEHHCHCCNVSNHSKLLCLFQHSWALSHLFKMMPPTGISSPHVSKRPCTRMHHWGHFDGTAVCPIPKDVAHPTNTENQAIKEWEREDAAARYHLFRKLPLQIVVCLADCPKTAKARWDGLTKELGQLGLEDTRK